MNGKRRIRQVGIGQPRQQVARLGPRDVEAAHDVGQAFETGARWQRNRPEEPLVKPLCHARADHQKSPSASFVTVKSPAIPPRLPISGVRQDRPGTLGIRLANSAFSQSSAPGPLHAVFGEVRDVDDARARSRNIRASRPTGAHQFCRVKPWVSSRRLSGRGEPQRMLPAVVQPEDRAHCLLHCMGRAQCAPGGPRRVPHSESGS